MRWAKTSLRNSFFGWMAHQDAAEPSDRVEDIRKAMLQLLEQNPDGRNSTIERRVLFAQSLDDLWYARPELMTAVAAVRGEAIARNCLADVTRMFEAGTVGRLLRRGSRKKPGKT